MTKNKDILISDLHDISRILSENGYAGWCRTIERASEALKKQATGQWKRMSDLPETEDDRYQCSHCKNVVHYKNSQDLYTFNGWCGRCGSDNNLPPIWEME